MKKKTPLLNKNQTLLATVASVAVASALVFCGFKMRSQRSDSSYIPPYAESYAELSHTVDNGKLLIKLGKNIFVAEGNNDGTTIPASSYPNAENLNWVKHSMKFVENDTTKTDVFDAKIVPNGKGVVVVLMNYTESSIHPISGMGSRSIYYLSESGTPENKAYSFANFFDNDFNEGRTFPRIAEISKDGSLAAFDLFGCWGCGGHNPEKLLISLDLDENYQRKTINLGQVQEFKFNDNGSFSYRPYPMECYDDNDWQQNIEAFTKCEQVNKKPVITKTL